MTMITPSYLGETIEYSSLHACRSTLEDPTRRVFALETVHRNQRSFRGTQRLVRRWNFDFFTRAVLLARVVHCALLGHDCSGRALAILTSPCTICHTRPATPSGVFLLPSTKQHENTHTHRHTHTHTHKQTHTHKTQTHTHTHTPHRWYVNSHVRTAKGKQYSFFASFFRIVKVGKRKSTVSFAVVSLRKFSDSTPGRQDRALALACVGFG